MEDGLMLATFFRSRNRDITALAKYPPHTVDHARVMKSQLVLAQGLMRCKCCHVTPHNLDGMMLATFFLSSKRDITALAQHPPKHFSRSLQPGIRQTCNRNYFGVEVSGLRFRF
jgi:hypothetical protein